MPALPSRSLLRLARLVLTCALLAPAVPAGAQTPPDITLTASLDSLHTVADGNAWSGSPALSANGGQLVFASAAALDEKDENGLAAIYLYEPGTGRLRRISTGAQGQLSDGWSFAPAISSDGRIAAFASLASVLGAGQSIPRAQVYTHDLSTGRTTLISKNTSGGPGLGWSTDPSLSADGRFVAFSSLANDLAASDQNPGSDVFLHDRRTGQTSLASITSSGEQASGWSAYPTLTADARLLAFVHLEGDRADILVRDLLQRRTLALSSLPGFPGQVGLTAPALSADGEVLLFSAAAPEPGSPFSLYLYLRAAGSLHPIPGSQARQAADLTFGLSPDGRFAAFSTAAPGQTGAITVYDRLAQTSQVLLPYAPGAGHGRSGTRLSLSAYGASLAYTQGDALHFSTNQLSGEPTHFLSGWVSDPQGYPLAGVELRDGYGRVAKTDAAGRFRLEGLRRGQYTLTPTKKGYTFTPETRQVRAGDLVWPGVGLVFTPQPDEILEAARQDLGMPYSTNRGCPTPWKGCGGPFFGFYAGDCTDLILDAFNEGAGFNIQHAMERDARLYPTHYYRWRDVRNAHDMWRFFYYSSQLLAPTAAYLPGDIVFFDWEKDGVVDHVALVSEVTGQGRPRTMLDATGKIAENPEGLAIELEWKSYHRDAMVGHARWNGIHYLPGPGEPARGPQLLANLDSYHVRLRLLDLEARTLSAESRDLPGGAHHDLGFSEALSLFVPGRETDLFLLELSYTPELDGFPRTAPYQLGIQTAHDGQVTQNQVLRGELAPGETLLVPVRLRLEDGKLRFAAELP